MDDTSRLQAPPQQQEPEAKKAKVSSSEEPVKPKYKRLKTALFFGYCGVGYQGMQKNPGAKTIEGELEEALFLAGAVPEHDRGFPNRYDWSRSARTDKGVSAVGQVVSARLFLDPPGLLHRLNSFLPAQIRAFGFMRTTPSFSSKKFCDRRRYVYLIPAFALHPNGAPSYGDQDKERFNRILNSYVGSHNFHNFTSRTGPEDPAAWRYILSFGASDTVTVDGIVFVKCQVVGQSFMLHQIRKMVGLAVAIIRGCAPDSFIQTALRKDVKINVPTAPEVGLYLDECLFSSYNNKWKDTHGELSMKDYAEEAEDFKIKHIYSHIAATEHKDGVVGLWLHSLNHQKYPDLRLYDGTGATTDFKRDTGEELTKDSATASDRLVNITEGLKTEEVEKASDLLVNITEGLKTEEVEKASDLLVNITEGLKTEEVEKASDLLVNITEGLKTETVEKASDCLVNITEGLKTEEVEKASDHLANITEDLKTETLEKASDRLVNITEGLKTDEKEKIVE